MSGGSSPASVLPGVALGLGCVTFGREIDRPTSFAMMDHALVHGVTVFDTASAYGDGASEALIGEWLRDRGTREIVTLGSKILPPYSPATIEAVVATSLSRLQTATLDVLYLHRFDSTVLDPRVL